MSQGYDLENIYKYHAPKEGQAEKYVALREKAKEYAEMILHLCPSSRERSTALTNLETSNLFANAAIARHGEAGPYKSQKSPIADLVAALKSDNEYHYGWQCNLAMMIVDVAARERWTTQETAHPAANEAATAFLKNLMRPRDGD